MNLFWKRQMRLRKEFFYNKNNKFKNLQGKIINKYFMTFLLLKQNK